ncbi:L-aspartate dehydrogenase [Methanimicrococcus sp. At1]|uniref:L-aspartate dehydrogenase n=1 Tax=Methanimicrococcus hacksteinii TaxID=3028293 RepID=A0ABU3VTD5_9EURY|nr:aspartate dehydrogenase [Methanimicrococcus sp. At1]MDV0446170.1 L-aspartate dehydrogenase [Methanimicrococcus sp. At1]
MIKIGVIGCGFIGTQICLAVDSGAVPAEIFGIFDFSDEKANAVLKCLKSSSPVKCSPEIMIESCDLIIECASQDAVLKYALPAAENGVDMMILSVGALQDPDFYETLEKTAAANHSKIYIPSGAIAGTDGLKAAAVANLSSVSVTTRKPISGLAGSPYLIEKGIDLADIQEPTLVFEGSAAEAVVGFPKNVNVCATISLCGIGFQKTAVRIIADPTISENIHELEVSGDFGRMKMIIENRPSPQNPKSSYLAALSAVSTLKKITSPIQIGV